MIVAGGADLENLAALARVFADPVQLLENIDNFKAEQAKAASMKDDAMKTKIDAEAAAGIVAQREGDVTKRESAASGREIELKAAADIITERENNLTSD